MSHGYPLVTFDMVREQQTNVATPDVRARPDGATDQNPGAIPRSTTTAVPRPTPIRCTPSSGSTFPSSRRSSNIPDMGDRYSIVPMLDGYSEVFHVDSPGTTGSTAHTYAITGPPLRRARSRKA